MRETASDELSLQNRQVVVRHLQDDQGHRRAVVGAHEITLPGAVAAAVLQEFVADGGVPLAPVVVNVPA